MYRYFSNVVSFENIIFSCPFWKNFHRKENYLSIVPNLTLLSTLLHGAVRIICNDYFVNWMKSETSKFKICPHRKRSKTFSGPYRQSIDHKISERPIGSNSHIKPGLILRFALLIIINFDTFLYLGLEKRKTLDKE